jgi:hypothetical protein
MALMMDAARVSFVEAGMLATLPSDVVWWGCVSAVARDAVLAGTQVLTLSIAGIPSADLLATMPDQPPPKADIALKDALREDRGDCTPCRVIGLYRRTCSASSARIQFGAPNSQFCFTQVPLHS